MTMETTYDRIIKAIGALPRVKSDSDNMLECGNYLTRNEPVISQFAKVQEMLKSYLDTYDFEKGCEFEEMRSVLVCEKVAIIIFSLWV